LFGHIFLLLLRLIDSSIQAHLSQEAFHCLYFIFASLEEADSRRRIPFGKFLPIHGFDEWEMNKLWGSESKYTVKVHMLIGISEPFFASHNVSNPHLPIVYNVGEVEGRPAIRSHNHKVIDGLELKFSEDFVLKGLWQGDEV
jgi:hypothetical protein